MKWIASLLLLGMLSGCAHTGDVSSTRPPSGSYINDAQQRLAALVIYPKESMRLGEEGACKVRFTIRRDGKVLSGKIIESSGFARLDAAAIAALKSVSRFPPVPENLQPNEQKILVDAPFRFVLPPTVNDMTIRSAVVAPQPRSYYGDIQNLVAAQVSYPQESRIAGEQGVCKLRMLIRRDGSLANAEIVQSSGFARLDEACLRGARAPVFPAIPESVDERYQQFFVEMPINFTTSP